MDENKTPQEVAIDAIKEKLDSMEKMQSYFHDRQMKKYTKVMRGLINDKTAELQRVQNHYNPPPDKDAREAYISQIEDENKKMEKEIKRLQVIINTNVAKDEK